MAQINFGGIIEEVVTVEEFPVKKAQETLKNETIAVLGYGVQGPAQAFNMRDNGISVIIGQAPEDKIYWEKAVADGWVPGETLFSIEEAVSKATIIQYLVSDAAQMILWPKVKANLKKGDALYFSHGFSITYKEQTGVVPPPDVDVIMVAPKGSGTSVRRNFLDGSGINSSYAIYQDATGRALERTLALGIAIGSGFLFPTTFQMEVYSDLTGERGVLMGALAGVMAAIPITPGGLGVVEAVLTPTLVGFGVPARTATIGVLAWRFVQFWLPIPLGGVAYLSLRFGALGRQHRLGTVRDLAQLTDIAQLADLT